MNTMKLYDSNGETSVDFEVDTGGLARGKGNQAVRDVLVAAMAARRTGTASTLSKGEVAGSNRKPWRQKGTGRARAGLKQSPVWRGGGVAFGPKPRDFGKKVNRKVARLALSRALNDRIEAGRVLLVESLAIEDGKTRNLANRLKKMGIERSCLIVDREIDPSLSRAAGNLPRVSVRRAAEFDLRQLLRHHTLLMSKAGLETAIERLTSSVKEQA